MVVKVGVTDIGTVVGGPQSIKVQLSGVRPRERQTVETDPISCVFELTAQSVGHLGDGLRLTF